MFISLNFSKDPTYAGDLSLDVNFYNSGIIAQNHSGSLGGYQLVLITSA